MSRRTPPAETRRRGRRRDFVHRPHATVCHPGACWSAPAPVAAPVAARCGRIGGMKGWRLSSRGGRFDERGQDPIQRGTVAVAEPPASALRAPRELGPRRAARAGRRESGAGPTRMPCSARHRAPVPVVARGVAWRGSIMRTRPHATWGRWRRGDGGTSLPRDREHPASLVRASRRGAAGGAWFDHPDKTPCNVGTVRPDGGSPGREPELDARRGSMNPARPHATRVGRAVDRRSPGQGEWPAPPALPCDGGG